MERLIPSLKTLVSVAAPARKGKHSPMTFLATLLVPMVIHKLTMEDMNLGEDEAWEVMAEGQDLGLHFNDDFCG